MLQLAVFWPGPVRLATAAAPSQCSSRWSKNDELDDSLSYLDEHELASSFTSIPSMVASTGTEGVRVGFALGVVRIEL